MAARSGVEAYGWARRQISERDRNWKGLCQMFVRSAFGVGGGFGSAITQWNGAKKKHPTKSTDKIPLFVPIFWRGGKYGHVALYIGNGRCISTDAKRSGWPDIVTVNSITRSWGYEFLGWTEDLNGHQVYDPKTPPAGSVPERVGGDTIRGIIDLYKLEQHYKELCKRPSNPEKTRVGKELEKKRAMIDLAYARRIKHTVDADLVWLKKERRTKTLKTYEPLAGYVDWLVRFKMGA